MTYQIRLHFLVFLLIFFLTNSFPNAQIEQMHNDLTNWCRDSPSDFLTLNNILIDKEPTAKKIGPYFYYKLDKSKGFSEHKVSDLFKLETTQEFHHAYYITMHNLLKRVKGLPALLKHFDIFEECFIHRYKSFGIKGSHFSKFYFQAENNDNYLSKFSFEELKNYKLTFRVFLFHKICELYLLFYKNNFRMIRIDPETIKFDYNFEITLPLHILGSFIDLSDPNNFYLEPSDSEKLHQDSHAQHNPASFKASHAIPLSAFHIFKALSKYPKIAELEQNDIYSLGTIMLYLFGINLYKYFDHNNAKCLLDEANGCREELLDQIALRNKNEFGDGPRAKELAKFYLEILFDRNAKHLSEVLKRLDLVNFYIKKASEGSRMRIFDLESRSMVSLQSMEDLHLTAFMEQKDYSTSDFDVVMNPKRIFVEFDELMASSEPTARLKNEQIYNKFLEFVVLHDILTNEPNSFTRAVKNAMLKPVRTFYSDQGIFSVELEQASFLLSACNKIYANFEFSLAEKFEMLASLASLLNQLIKSEIYLINMRNKDIAFLVYFQGERAFGKFSRKTTFQAKFLPTVFLDFNEQDKIPFDLPHKLCRKEAKTVFETPPPEAKYICQYEGRKFLTDRYEVWNFGILLIQTLFPMIQAKTAEALFEDVQNSLSSLKEFSVIEVELKKLIFTCFRENANERPHFSELFKKLREMAEITSKFENDRKKIV